MKRLVAEIRHCCDAIVDRESRPGKADRASTAVRDLWVERGGRTSVDHRAWSGVAPAYAPLGLALRHGQGKSSAVLACSSASMHPTTTAVAWEQVGVL